MGELAPLTQLTPRQQRFIHLYLTGQYTQTELANIVEIDIATARKWLRNPTVQEYIEEFQKEEHEIVENAIKNMRAKALERLNELMDSKNDNVALQATKDVLDRTGHKAITKIEKDVNIRTFEEQLNDLIGKTIDDYIDVEAVEVEE